MSRDNTTKETTDVVANTEVKMETSSSSAEKISAEERRELALKRRAQSNTLHEQGAIRSLGHIKYVPDGFKSFYVPPSDAERLFAKGYDYVQDDQGSVCKLSANKGRDAPEHNFVMMMAPEEIVQDDMEASAKKAREICDNYGSTLEEATPNVDFHKP